MLFKDRRHEQIAAERLARLLRENPAPVGSVETMHRPYDFCRALVTALLLTSITGTWSVAYFLGHP
jgi:hypothetical protein